MKRSCCFNELYRRFPQYAFYIGRNPLMYRSRISDANSLKITYVQA